MCDRLLYLAQGKLAFYGSPDDLTTFFGVRSIEDVYARQSERAPEEWEAAFQRSPLGEHAAAYMPAVSAEDDAKGTPAIFPVSTEALIAQTWDLISRYIRLQLADWKNLLLLFGQAPIIGLMIGATFGSIKIGFAEQHAADTKQVLFVLVLAVLWCSGTISVREIVRETPILQHETRFGVGLLPYLLSKLLLLGFISLTQTTCLLTIVRHSTHLTGSFDLQFLILGLTALVGVALGLLVSAAAGTSERAMTLLPVLLIGQAIFSGGLARLSGWGGGIAETVASAYSSLDGLKAPLSSDLLNATYPGAPGNYQAPILGSGKLLILDAMILVVHLSVLLFATLFILRGQIRGLFAQSVASELRALLHSLIGQGQAALRRNKSPGSDRDR